MFTQVGVKQLIDFLRTVTAASDLVDCTLVNCVFLLYGLMLLKKQIHVIISKERLEHGKLLVPLSQRSSRGHTPKLAKASR